MPIDPEKLGQLLDRYWPVLVEWLGGAGGARDGVEDVVQAAFIKLATEEPPPTNCVAWLFTVAKRTAINEQVSRTSRRARESHAGMGRPEAFDAFAEVELHDLLNVLEFREREVVIARIWGELTFDEIATLHGDSKSSVWRTYQSGISKLREVYRECPNE